MGHLQTIIVVVVAAAVVVVSLLFRDVFCFTLSCFIVFLFWIIFSL